MDQVNKLKLLSHKIQLVAVILAPTCLYAWHTPPIFIQVASLMSAIARLFTQCGLAGSAPACIMAEAAQTRFVVRRFVPLIPVYFNIKLRWEQLLG